MPDLLGRFVRCQVGGPSSTWLPILGERSTRISYERQPVDCTTRTEVWQTCIGGGVGSRSITVSGVARKGAGWSVIMQSQFNGTSVPLRFLDVADAVYGGSGLVSKLTQEMAHDGAQLYSVEFVLGPAIYDGYITSTYTSTWTGTVWGTPVLVSTTVVPTLPVGVNTWTAVGLVATGTFTVCIGDGDFNGVVGVVPAAPVLPLPNLLPAPCGTLGGLPSTVYSFTRPAYSGAGITSRGIDLAPFIQSPYATNRCIEVDLLIRRRSGPSSEPQTGVRAGLCTRAGWNATAGNLASGLEAPACTPSSGCGVVGVDFNGGTSDACSSRYPTTQADASATMTVRGAMGSAITAHSVYVYAQTGFSVEAVTVDVTILAIRCV